MGGDPGFWNLDYSMRRAAYGYLCFRSAARFGFGRGFLRCAECGRRLSTISYSQGENKYKAQYYVCGGARGVWSKKAIARVKSGTCATRRMRREVLESMLDEIVAKRLANPEFLAKLIEAQAEADEDGSAEIRAWASAPEVRFSQCSFEIEPFSAASSALMHAFPTARPKTALLPHLVPPPCSPRNATHQGNRLSCHFLEVID
jgi:hypothetical protein